MAKTIKIILKEDPEKVVDRAKKLIEYYGGSMRGYYDAGRFSCKGVSGSFAINSNMATITITDKPFLASWDLVEGKIKEFFK